MTLEVGRVHVYTGDAKGKTTAAMGLALRAVGHGLKVRVIQFMKADGEKSGEIRVLERLLGREVLRFGRGFFDAPNERDYEEARLGMAEARRCLAAACCDLLILDELNVAVHFGLIDSADVVDLVNAKPGNLELVLTGRYAHPAIIEVADYVTDMSSVKHPYDLAFQARRGIEF